MEVEAGRIRPGPAALGGHRLTKCGIKGEYGSVNAAMIAKPLDLVDIQKVNRRGRLVREHAAVHKRIAPATRARQVSVTGLLMH